MWLLWPCCLYRGLRDRPLLQWRKFFWYASRKIANLDIMWTYLNLKGDTWNMFMVGLYANYGIFLLSKNLLTSPSHTLYLIVEGFYSHLALYVTGKTFSSSPRSFEKGLSDLTAHLSSFNIHCSCSSDLNCGRSVVSKDNYLKKPYHFKWSSLKNVVKHITQIAELCFISDKSISNKP